MGKIGPFSEFSTWLESRPNRFASDIRIRQEKWVKMRKTALSILQTSALPLGYRALAQSKLQRGAITVCRKWADKQFRGQCRPPLASFPEVHRLSFRPQGREHERNHDAKGDLCKPVERDRPGICAMVGQHDDGH